MKQIKEGLYFIHMVRAASMSDIYYLHILVYMVKQFKRWVQYKLDFILSREENQLKNI